jgi:hypothetical protein
MSATDQTYDAKHARLPDKADSRETLKALARLLACQASADASRVSTAPVKTGCTS